MNIFWFLDEEEQFVSFATNCVKETSELRGGINLCSSTLALSSSLSFSVSVPLAIVWSLSGFQYSVAVQRASCLHLSSLFCSSLAFSETHVIRSRCMDSRSYLFFFFTLFISWAVRVTVRASVSDRVLLAATCWNGNVFDRTRHDLGISFLDSCSSLLFGILLALLDTGKQKQFIKTVW